MNEGGVFSPTPFTVGELPQLRQGLAIVEPMNRDQK